MPRMRERHRSMFLALVLVALPQAACSLFATSPALKSPLSDRLAKAGTTTIEDAAKACLAQAGWKPDEIGGLAEGATVVSATNSAKDRVSLYIQSPDMKPRVTGGPDYDDPFWKCLGRELGGQHAAPAADKESDKEGDKDKDDVPPAEPAK
jgi:hypothetical protein